MSDSPGLPAEANRLPLRLIEGAGVTFYVQEKYPSPSIPIDDPRV